MERKEEEQKFPESSVHDRPQCGLLSGDCQGGFGVLQGTAGYLIYGLLWENRIMARHRTYNVRYSHEGRLQE